MTYRLIGLITYDSFAMYGMKIMLGAWEEVWYRVGLLCESVLIDGN